MYHLPVYTLKERIYQNNQDLLELAEIVSDEKHYYEKINPSDSGFEPKSLGAIEQYSNH